MSDSVMYGDFGPIGEVAVEHKPNEQKAWCCPQCLRVFHNEGSGDAHHVLCQDQLPGIVVYRDVCRSINIHMISGKSNEEFVSRLCSLALREMPSKMENAHLENYEFYVCSVGKDFLERNCHTSADNRESSMAVCAFFSRDRTREEHNLSAIVTFRPFRSLGFGFLLVDFSYLLSMERIRSRSVFRALRDIDVLYPGPEFPLSSAGQRLYDRYWDYAVSKTMISTLIDQRKPTLCVKEISCLTGIDYFVVLDIFRRLAARSGMDASWVDERNVYRDEEIFQGHSHGGVDDSPNDVLLMKKSRKAFCSVNVVMEILLQLNLETIPMDRANVIRENLEYVMSYSDD
ncbi:histone acetyltransferase [Perkinsela sp. CCAP 1560/4]|nr:histone acetyltransferase [Perkinsela sp. CCAP 1560/4]|eukprot:KNH07420.1 histone acetyltransferase [Perkinsela sp. CCAP 1560/4]